MLTGNYGANTTVDSLFMTAFDELLEATISHVEGLANEGIRSLPVDEMLLRALKEGPRPRSQEPALEVPSPSPVEPLQAQAQELVRSDAAEVLAGPALSSEQRKEAMIHLQERAKACMKCPQLARSRQNVVFGVGSYDAELMFVGEAPGMDEDSQGEPFVGKAGQLLTKIIETMGLSRETVYIGNVLKCRPDTPGRRYGNRKPTPQEMVTCRPYLMEQIRTIRPKVLVALGATAVEGLMNLSSVAITRYRGEFKDFGGIPLMPTYHPSYVLRNQSHRIKRQIWEDMLKVMARLEMPISEKQRGYFTKSS